MKSGSIILGILFCFNILAWVAVYDLAKGAELLEVTFFDVGQGDSIFVETPSGHQILIDGGPDGTVLEKLGKEMPFWDRTIDLIILSHPEHDHMAGLMEVLKRYKVENILWTGIVRDTAEFKEWQKLIKEEEAKIYIAQAGQKFGFLNILYPFESFDGKTVSNTNNTSIIIRLVFGENSFLFTGDASKSVERQLLGKTEQPIDSDVLKVGHHGSKTSSAPEFIQAISPNIAVISVSKDNSYGHPSEETLETLEKYGINILRTDLDKNIKFLCSFQSFKLK